MTGIQSLEARTALGAVFAVSGLHRGLQQLDPPPTAAQLRSHRNLAFIALALRPLLPRLLRLHLPVRGDIPAFYVFPQAHWPCSISCPTATYPSSYAPLHSFLDAGSASSLELATRDHPLRHPRRVPHPPRLAARRAPLRLRVRLCASPPCSTSPAPSACSSSPSTARITSSSRFCSVSGFSHSPAESRSCSQARFVSLGAVLIKFLPLLFAPAFFLGARALAALAHWVRRRAHLGYGSSPLAPADPVPLFAWKHGSRTASDLPLSHRVHRQPHAAQLRRRTARSPSRFSSSSRVLPRARLRRTQPRSRALRRRLRLRLAQSGAAIFLEEILAALSCADALPARPCSSAKAATAAFASPLRALQRRGGHYAQHLGHGLQPVPRRAVPSRSMQRQPMAMGPSDHSDSASSRLRLAAHRKHRHDAHAHPSQTRYRAATHQSVDCSDLKLTSRYRSTVTALPFCVAG